MTWASASTEPPASATELICPLVLGTLSPTKVLRGICIMLILWPFKSKWTYMIMSVMPSLEVGSLE